MFFALVAVSFCVKAFGEVTRFPMLIKARLDEMKISTQFGENISESTLRGLMNNDFLNISDKMKRNETELAKSEFVILMLHLMGKIEEKDVLLATQVFEFLDKDKTGILTSEKIESEAVRAGEREREKRLEQEKLEAAEASSLAGQASSFVTSMGGLVFGAIETALLLPTNEKNENSTPSRSRTPTISRTPLTDIEYVGGFKQAGEMFMNSLYTSCCSKIVDSTYIRILLLSLDEATHNPMLSHGQQLPISFEGNDNEL